MLPCITMYDIGKVPLIFAEDFSLIAYRSCPKKLKLMATPIKEVKRSFDFDDMKANVEKEVETATNENDLTAQFQALYLDKSAKQVRIYRCA